MRMRTMIKRLFFVTVPLLLLYLYVVHTPTGKQKFYHYASYFVSQQSGLCIDLKYIDFKQFPTIRAIMNIEHKAKLILEGSVAINSIDIDYVLTSRCIASDICEINDNINIFGEVQGKFDRLNIVGEGEMLDGNVTYSFIKYSNKVEALKLLMKGVSSQKLLTLLGKEPFIKGEADVTIAFDVMQTDSKQGSIIYDIKDNNFSGIPLNLHTKIDIMDMHHQFMIDLTSPYLALHLTKGHYDQFHNIGDAFYTIDIKEISKLKTLLGYPYKGSFYAMGEIEYNQHLRISGLSKSFGGMVDYLYENDGLHIILEDSSFMEFMNLFELPPVLEAKATGDLYYNFIQKTFIANTTLNEARIVNRGLIKEAKSKLGIDLSKEIFHKSLLDASYHNDLLIADVKLKNQESHLFLTSVLLNLEKDNADAYFDFDIQQQAFSGKLFGSFDALHVNLDMQKLMRYQMDKQLDALLGKKNRQVIEKIPMGETVKEVSTGMSASFIKIFF